MIGVFHCLLFGSIKDVFVDISVNNCTKGSRFSGLFVQLGG